MRFLKAAKRGPISPGEREILKVLDRMRRELVDTVDDHEVRIVRLEAFHEHEVVDDVQDPGDG